MIKAFLRLSLLGLLAAQALAAASTTVEGGVTPQDTFIAYAPGGPVTRSVRWSYNNQRPGGYNVLEGQSFKVPADKPGFNVLTAFTLYLGYRTAAPQTPQDAYRAMVWEYDPVTRLVVTPPLYEGPMTPTPTVSDWELSGWNAITTTFPDGVVLDPAKTYLFALQGMAGDGGYTFAENQENGVWSYPDGMSLYLGDPVWTNTWSAADVDYDLYFWATFSPSCNPAGIALTGKASRKVAKRGSLIRYTVTVANTNKTPFDKGGVEVTLPAGVTYQKSRASPRAKNTALDTVVVTGNTVTLPDAPLKGKGRRRFTVYAKVDSTAVAGSDLAFAAATCSLSTTSTVKVK